MRVGFENPLGRLAPTPMAETWTTRRMPAIRQASNKAPVASTWMRAVSSRAPSCSTPTQLTTASMPASGACQSAGVVSRAKSAVIHRA
jgi:hypothetical protein